jgi:AraC family transcriptional regulator
LALPSKYNGSIFLTEATLHDTSSNRPTRTFSGLEERQNEILEPSAAVEWLVDQLIHAVQQRPQMARTVVVQLVSQLLRQETSAGSARGGLAGWQVRKIDRYLQDNLTEALRVDELAKHVSLSTSHFSRAFSRTFGATPQRHVAHLRLKAAQRMILETDMSLTQISLASGFADRSHLSKAFRRLLGDTPSAWRRRNLAEARRSFEDCSSRDLSSQP